MNPGPGLKIIMKVARNCGVFIIFRYRVRYFICIILFNLRITEPIIIFIFLGKHWDLERLCNLTYVIQLTCPMSLTLEPRPIFFPLVLLVPVVLVRLWWHLDLFWGVGCLHSALWQGRWQALAAATVWFYQLLANIYHHILLASTVALQAGTAPTVPANFLVVISLLLGLHRGSCCHRRVMKHQGSQVGTNGVR